MSAAEKLTLAAEALTTLSDLAREFGVTADDLSHAEQATLGREAAAVEHLLERTLGLFKVLGAAEEEPAPESRRATRGVRPSDTTLADMLYVGGLELERTLRAVRDAHGFDGVSTLIESARRKLARAVHAVLIAARATPATELGSARLRQRLGAELESALAVRRLYADFRRGLRRATDPESEAVLTALRYAAGALATLAASPHYAVVRASDRALLRRQRDRLLEWSRAGQSMSLGLKLLEDIWTSADLLRDINQRQELRAHDFALIAALLGEPPRDHAQWLTQLDRLRGLDDTLDALAQGLHGAGGAASLTAVAERLAALASR